jgi:hypothetical protein
MRVAGELVFASIDRPFKSVPAAFTVAVTAHDESQVAALQQEGTLEVAGESQKLLAFFLTAGALPPAIHAFTVAK